MSSQTSRVTRSRAKQISATSKQEQTDHTDTTIPSESTAASADAGEVDATKLKGIVWPGMGIFDAATSEQKRMRNQKKDSSVLQNMITTSKSVHHDKFVWDDDFAGVPRIRDIYASPSTDGSPDADEDEDKQAKKKRGRRPAMVEDGDSIRQTRSTTKAATQGRRGPKPKMPLKKVKDESDSDAEEMNDGLSDDVFHDNRTRRSGKPITIHHQ
ncbi:putative type-2 protein geranylgeranyltransferase subunit beta protein [Phaeoacremonium minimum UCRPA7]|uniref:Putative type-2 protein geranylgeranyltransferase subunit beta protein n=1 Tax=Phaeoacremonium minimum (strain UCR-PA7) TaxID=1286976 RepID=R8BAX7_PHAM7|nr:putative type-2 protein geranylgeranyltransferase subunit beta protein [Phaeoacremonium minimum UCRPA7]EON96444.1 putative type-2 protein geranylgeranyltransferase subunit beta protein [Phaeoacremonium minimum UCRPA7]